MASKFPEQDILVKGILSTDTKSGTEWIQNLWTPNKTLEVRPGFGQVSQIDSTLSRFNNYDPASETDSTTQHVLGFQKVLGSYVMKTVEGQIQIISVFKTLGLSTSSDAAISSSGYSQPRRIACYEVVIYDVDNDQRWHEILPTRTSNKNAGNRSPKFWHAGYETNSDKDWNDTLVGEGDATVSFVELDGYLFFGSNDIPLFCYNPSTFRSQLTQPTRRKQVTVIDDNDSSYEPYGETCSIVRVSPSVNDALGQAFDFLDSHELPNPTSVTEFQGRLAVGRDKTVRFSDLNFLSAWKTLDFIQIPSFNDITCMTSVGQFLYIFTSTETFLYRSPASGALLSGGEIIKVSDEIGCFGPLAHSRIQGVIVFADASGIHTVNGSTIKTLSGPIKHMFQGGISSPLNNYTTQTGWLTYTNDQPRTFFDVRDDEEFVTIAYDELTTSLFCTIPRLNLTVVFKASSGFTFWNFEDIVTPDSTVNAKRNLPNPQVLALDGEIYLVGGIEDKLFNSSVTDPATGGTAEGTGEPPAPPGQEEETGGGGGGGGGGAPAPPPTAPVGSPEVWLQADSIDPLDPAYVTATSGMLKWDNDGSLGGNAVAINTFAPPLYVANDPGTNTPGLTIAALHERIGYTFPAPLVPFNQATIFLVAHHDVFANQPFGLSGIRFSQTILPQNVQYTAYTQARLGLNAFGGLSVEQQVNTAAWYGSTSKRVDSTQNQEDLITNPDPYAVYGFRLNPPNPATDYATIETPGSVSTLRGSGAIISAGHSCDPVSATATFQTAPGSYQVGVSPATGTGLGLLPDNVSTLDLLLGESFRGTVFEVIIYLNPLSDADFLATQQYLTNKYNLP